MPNFEKINAVGASTVNLPLNISFISVYIPAKKQNLPEACVRRDLLKLLEFVKSLDHCIMGGDFNAFHHSWGSHYMDDRGILLVNELENLCLLNDGTPTHLGSKVGRSNPIDLTWSTSDILERLEWRVEMDCLGSDHLFIGMRLAMNMFSEEIKVKPKLDEAAFQSNIERLSMENIDNLPDFILAIDGARGEAISRPQVLKKPKFVPKSYWNEELRTFHRRKKFALVRYFRHMTAHNLIEYKRLDAIFKRKIKAARSESFRQWAETLSPNTPIKDIFRSFKRLNNYRVPNQSNSMFRSPEMVDNFLQKLCKSDNPSVTMTITPSDTEPPFLMEELITILVSKLDSAPGLDGIKYSTILNFPIHIKEKFLELVNKIWAVQDVPAELKRILMVLLPKPGRDLQLLGSHRPIALLSVYLKIINSMIKNRLEKFILENSTLDDRSYGFVRHRSAVNCVNHLLSTVRSKQVEGFEVMGIFVDLEDAFNNVSLKKLQSFMNRLGVPIQYANWIVSCYQEREINVDTMNGMCTARSNEGIPQGDVLSPLIFLLYTSSIFHLEVDNSEIFQFADDICIIVWDTNLTDVAERLQQATAQFLSLITDIDMQISPTKSKAIWFNANRKIYQPVLRIGTTFIEFVTSVKYLGIFLDEKLNFQRHITELLLSVEKRLNIIKMFAGNKWGGHPSTLLMILKSVVRSKIEYGCSIYGIASQRWLNKIAVAYNRGLRICLRSLKTTPIPALETEAGSVPLNLRRQYLTRREVLKAYEHDFPITIYLDSARYSFDGGGATYLEQNCAEISDILDEICKARFAELPNNLNISTTLDDSVDLHKKDLTEHQWRFLANSKMTSEYGEHYKIFTDASKQADGRTGIGLTDMRNIRNCERLSGLFQITSAELVAILKAIYQCERIRCNKVVIFTDSMSGCRWIERGLRNNYLVHAIRDEAQQMPDRSVVIQWIPSHVGIGGNNEADELANRGCYANSISEMKITFSDAMWAIKNRMMDAWQNQYELQSRSKGRKHFDILKKISDKPWFRGIELSGAEIKLLTRLRTNHGMSGTVKHLFKLQDSPLCDLCQSQDDLEHIILECRKFQSHRDIFKIRSSGLIELLKDRNLDRYKSIIAFCRAAEIKI